MWFVAVTSTRPRSSPSGHSELALSAMSTPPRPGSHLPGHQNAPDRLRTEVEPLLDELITVSTDVGEMERQASVAEAAHRLLSECLASDEVR